MFEEKLDYENDNNIIINNDKNINYKNQKFNNTNNYEENNNDNYDGNNNINNININQQPINNQNDTHHSHRSNLMQARISTEDDVKDIFNTLDKNTNKEELKKNIFG